MNIRKIMTVVEDVASEGGRPVQPAARTAAALAIVQNPWANQGFVTDLGPGIEEHASPLGALLAPKVAEALGAPIEAYGKAAIVGLDGEVEHGSALIHTLHFGDHFRAAASASTLLPAVEKRAGAGTVFDVPLKHVTDASTRSHHQTVELRVPDGPGTGEIVIGLVAAAQGRPQARLAPISTEQ